MTPKSATRFSDQVMRQEKRMTPKSAGRFSDQVMRQKNRMTPKSAGRFSRTNAFVCPEVMLRAKLMTLARLMSQLEKA
jgi:hypothetical protein